MSPRTKSSTQGSDLSTTASISDTSSSSFTSYRDFSAQDILDEIQRLQSQGIHYLGEKNLTSLCEFTYNNTLKGDVLVPKDMNTNDSLQEFILTGVFQIDGRNFFMTSDGKWNPNNPIGTRFDQAKGICHISSVQRDPEFSIFSNDFPSLINNLRAIEHLTNPRKSPETNSVIIGDSSGIKLTHHLFVVIPPFFLTTLHSFFFLKEKNQDLDSDLTNSSDISIEDWPVQPSNQPYLDEIKNSHNVQQIPAYDIRGDPIHPLQYEEKLAGAIVRVCFTMVHYLIKQKHIYNAIPHDITVLRPPTKISSPKTSLKRILHNK